MVNVEMYTEGLQVGTFLFTFNLFLVVLKLHFACVLYDFLVIYCIVFSCAFPYSV